jgi:hypothetical protein
MISAFRYSGNKSRMFQNYKRPMFPVRRIVEPYAGSMAYSLNLQVALGRRIRSLGFDTNEYLTSMWRWLTSSARAGTLSGQLQGIRDQVLKAGKVDVRTIDWPDPIRTYVRVNVCSVMVGQLSSWTIYPKHSLPIENTIAAVPYMKLLTVHPCDALQYRPEPGDLVFIDPPYINTSANYVGRAGKTDKGYTPAHTMALLEKLRGVPVIFTYGDSAPQLFPTLKWGVVAKRKVPNIRMGGTVDRTEYVCYLPEVTWTCAS